MRIGEVDFEEEQNRDIKDPEGKLVKGEDLYLYKEVPAVRKVTKACYFESIVRSQCHCFSMQKIDSLHHSVQL